jgi:hypothetical protein
LCLSHIISFKFVDINFHDLCIPIFVTCGNITFLWIRQFIDHLSFSVHIFMVTSIRWIHNFMDWYYARTHISRNFIFLASKLEVSMINKKNINFARTQVQKMAKFERKQQTICILADLGFSYTTGTSNISRLSFIFISFNLA